MSLVKSSVLGAAVLGVAGCASTPSARTVVAQVDESAVRELALTDAAGAGAPREVRVVVDTPALKLVSITLRGGTALPEHRSAVPVTIVAYRGAGAVITGSERHRLDATHAVMLSPNIPHAVEPEAGSDLVLLVSHLGRGAEHHP